MDPDLLDRTYHVILTSWVESARAPHFTDVARALRVSPDEARRRLHAVIATGLPNWLFPDTDLIASFAPFHALPTPYRVSVDGRSGWHAQCGFESVAVGWLFPGREVRIDATCLDCGDPLSVAMRDGVIVSEEPHGIVAYVGCTSSGRKSTRPAGRASGASTRPGCSRWVSFATSWPRRSCVSA